MKPGELRQLLNDDGFTMAQLSRVCALSVTTLLKVNSVPGAVKHNTLIKVKLGIHALRTELIQRARLEASRAK